MRRLPFVVYNLAPAGDPGREPAQVERELNALAKTGPFHTRRKIIATMEAVGRPMPDLPRYKKIRDTSNPSRANLCLYVRDDLHIGHVRWFQHKIDWPRVLHAGMHEPRATLRVEVEDWTVVLGHAPQAPGPRADTVAARQEWLRVMGRLLDRQGPVLALSDPNGLGDDLLAPGVTWAGGAIESAHGRGCVLDRVGFIRSANGVRLLSDHGHAMVGRAKRT